MTRTLVWEPILSDELVPGARAAAAAVAAGLAGRDVAVRSPWELCESALVFAYLALAEPSDWRDRAIEYLNTAAERISSTRLRGHELYGGLAGVGWTVEHLSTILGGDVESGTDVEEEDPLEDIDKALIDGLKRSPPSAPYDLIQGVVGIGVYFLQRLPRPAARQGIGLIVDLLERQAEPFCGGFTWHTPAEQLVDWQREVCPDGYYNLGVAHGVPGVIEFLGEVAGAGIEVKRTHSLLEGAVHWLLAQRRPPEAVSRYDAWFVPGREPADCRLGWCYGDLGIGAVLHHTAENAGREDWLRSARDLLDRCLDWPPDRTGIQDAALCHGAFGVAHVYNRVYQSDGNVRYKDAANSWYGRGLAMRQEGIGVGGFPAWSVDPHPGYVADASFLSGAAGVALALISAAAPLEPQWDRLLLLSGCSGI